jgi:hypothetical protein
MPFLSHRQSLHPEEGDRMTLRNVDTVLHYYKASQPRIPRLQPLSVNVSDTTVLPSLRSSGLYSCLIGNNENELRVSSDLTININTN